MSETPHFPAGRTVRPLGRTFIDEFTRRLLAVWHGQDTTLLHELVTEDVVWSDPALAEPVCGVAGVRQFMGESWRAFPDLRFDATGVPVFAEEAPVVMVPWRMTGTHLGELSPVYAATGRRMDVEGIDPGPLSPCQTSIGDGT